MTVSNPLTQTQKRRNAQSGGNWAITAPHRRRVTEQLIAQKCADHPQLCALGAGNCHDLDLQQLQQAFERIELIDIDLAALQHGIAAQDCQENAALRLHGDCDVTGVWQPLVELADATDQDAAIDQLLAQSAAWSGLTACGPYGSVVSTCLLSQLIDGVMRSIGEQHPRCLEVITAIRQRHLRLLYDLTAPGGRAALFTDFVSSDTAPTLPTLSGQTLARTLEQMISQHNFFTGLNPFRLQGLLTEDPYLTGKIDDLRCEKPWLWNFGPRVYAVTAISFQRRQGN